MISAQRNLDVALSFATESQIERGMNWYSYAHDQCLTGSLETGVDFNVLVGVVSALSPQMKWEANLKAAVLSVSDPHYRPPTYGSNILKAKEIASGRPVDQVLKGPKTSAFYHCIVNPEQRSRVAIDRHQIRLLYPKKDDVFRMKMLGYFYEELENLHILSADKAGVDPAQLQAITWLVQRETKS